MVKEIDKAYVLNTYARGNLSFTHGKNAKLYDDKGRECLDFMSGIGVNSVGHANDRLCQVIAEQSKKIIHSSNLFYIELQGKLAQELSRISGYDYGTFFGNSGAEANEGAIKIARKYGQKNFKNKKYKILTLNNSFHGRTITTIKATGQTNFHQIDFAPYPDGFSFYENIDELIKGIDEVTVAVMIELVQGEGGVQELDIKKVQELEKILKEKNILLIVDEVQSGVFRSGEFLASNIYKIYPDIITLAKGLAGGVPIGAVMTKHKDIFSPGDHGSTFGGNHLSCACAIEVLNILEKYKDEGHLQNTINKFEEKLTLLLQNYPNIFEEKTGLGLMRGLRCKSNDLLIQIISKSLEEGVLVLKSGRNTLRFLPPLTIEDEEINEGFKRLQKALMAIK